MGRRDCRAAASRGLRQLCHSLSKIKIGLHYIKTEADHEGTARGHHASNVTPFRLYYGQIPTRDQDILSSVSMSLLIVDDKPIEGVYSAVDFATYKRHARSRAGPLTVCTTCGQESNHLKEGGVELKICRGVSQVAIEGFGRGVITYCQCLDAAFCSKEVGFLPLGSDRV